MSKYEEYKERTISVIKEDCCMLEDGYLRYWPQQIRGYLSADDLRIIADYLDESNKAWDDQVNEYFAQRS